MRRYLIVLLFAVAFAADCMAAHSYVISFPPSTYPTYDRYGLTPGPYDAGGDMIADCTIYDLSYSPPHQTTAHLDTGYNYFWIGVLIPGGQRVPCHESLQFHETKEQAGSLPPPSPGDSGVPGIQGGVLTLDWIYLSVVYHREKWAKVWCDGTTIYSDSKYNTSGPC